MIMEEDYNHTEDKEHGARIVASKLILTEVTQS